MTEYVAPTYFPYTDLPDTGTPVYADDFANPIVEILLELAGAGGRVPALETAVTALGSGATYTDENARDAIGAALVAGSGITITVNDGADTITVASSSAALPTYGPADLGWLTWSVDPALASSSSAPNGAGVMALTRVKLPTAATVTSICLQVATAGATLTSGQNFAGLFDSTGARVGVTADLSTAWASTGYKEHALTSPYAAAAGSYWVALLCNGTTLPLFSRAASSLVTNAGLTAATARFGAYGSAQTAIPSSITPASIVITSAGANTVSYMVGLK